jgi:hypothetical protein
MKSESNQDIDERESRSTFRDTIEVCPCGMFMIIYQQTIRKDLITEKEMEKGPLVSDSGKEKEKHQCSPNLALCFPETNHSLSSHLVSNAVGN